MGLTKYNYKRAIYQQGWPIRIKAKLPLYHYWSIQKNNKIKNIQHDNQTSILYVKEHSPHNIFLMIYSSEQVAIKVKRLSVHDKTFT